MIRNINNEGKSMFLMKLQSKEKFAFLQLAHYLARIDNTYEKKEEEIILEYCNEMGIDNLDSFDMEKFDLDSILKSFSSKKSKKIVVLELMILIYIDDSFNIDEKKIIEKIMKEFGLSSKKIEKCSLWGKSISRLYIEGKRYINQND